MERFKRKEWQIIYICKLDKKYLFIFLLAKSNDIYAIEKPTYEDLIRGKYGDELDEGKIKSLAQEESILKETYAKGIANTVKEQMELQNNSIFITNNKTL